MKGFIGVDERPPLPSLIFLGLQHVLALFTGVIAVPLIVGAGLHLSNSDITILVQGSLITSGLGTLLQCLGIGKLGARLPICMGTAFTFIAPFIAVGNQLGIRAVFGSAIVCGILSFILSFFIWKVQKLIPPIVTGTVISLIGLGLLPLGFTWMIGGQTKMFGHPISFLLGFLVLITLLVLSQLKGLLSSFSVIIAISAGYIVSAIFGVLDTKSVAQASWISIPNVFHFGTPTFSFSAIITIFIAQLAAMLESMGNTYGTGAVAGREIGKRELTGSISVEGLMSSVAAIFNGFSITCFSQNIGVIHITRVASRFAVAASGVILIVVGLFPKFSAIIAGMPAPVLGGASMIMFGSIVASGVSQLRTAKEFGQREMLIFATSIALGLGFSMAPKGALDHLPSYLTVILQSGIAVGGFTAIILNKIIPKRSDDFEENMESNLDNKAG